MVLLSACAVHTVFLDGDVLLLDLLLDDDVLLLELLLDLPSRLFFSLGAFPAAKGSLVRVRLDLLLDGDVLLLDGDVLLASVRICLRGCSSVRCKISWKCPSDIRVHEFAPERSGELVNVVGAA